MNFKKLTSTLLVAGMCTAAFAADDAFSLKGNVQTQATKMVADDDNVLSSFWIRANIGGQYKSDNLDGLVMLRIFAPEFGNSLSDGSKTKNYDKILADLYWANYKWSINENNKMNLKVGHWKTDWSQSTHFGTYIDKDLTARGLWMRDYSHNALELGWKSCGISTLNVMVATKDNHFNTGYVRVEEDLKFSFPLEMKFAYRSNAIDRLKNTAALTHRYAAYISYSVIPELRFYGELAHLSTMNETINTEAHNYIAPESKYFKQDKTYNPFYVGIEFAPKSGLMNTLMSSLFLELERIGDRQEISNSSKKMDDMAWTIAWAKKIGASKLQFSLYNGNKFTDLGLAFRLTSTFK